LIDVDWVVVVVVVVVVMVYGGGFQGLPVRFASVAIVFPHSLPFQCRSAASSWAK